MRWRVRAALVTVGGLAGCIVPAPNRASSESRKLVVWDGDLYADDFQLGFTRGAPPPRRAQHWAHCNGDGCVSTLSVGSNGHDGKGIAFHGEGPGWMGFGFAWAGWNRRSTLDVSRYQGLSFWLKVALHSGSLGDTAVGLHCPDQGNRPGEVPLASLAAADLADGRWHRIALPLSAFAAQELGLDLRRVWDFGVGSWGGARSFDLYVDEIAFEERLP